MDTIYVSGIPKGLNTKATSLLIRKHIESVAQVNEVWIYKERGCGHVTLFDSTSVDMVLSLDWNIKVNGCPIRLFRKRQNYPRTKPKENPQVDPIRSRDYTRATTIAYETYTAYKEDVPQTDLLYQYAKPVPPRCQRKQRKPWNDTARISSIQTPKGGRVYKRRSRRKKKKQQSRSQHLHCVTITSDRKKQNSDCRRKSVDIEMNVVNTQETSDTGLVGDGLVVKPNDDISLPSISQVHVYDHGKHVCDIYVDNDNVTQSINDEVSRECKIPVSHLLLWYNGKTIKDSWPLYIENGDNIHLSVKGIGGMMKGKMPGLQREEFLRFDYSGYFKINVVSKDLASTSMIKLKIEEGEFVKFCHFFTCDLQLRTLKKALEYKWHLDIVQTGYPPMVCQQRRQTDLNGENIKELLTTLCFQLDVIDFSSTAWDINQIKQILSSLDSYQNGTVIGYDVSGDTLRHWIVGESGSIANVYGILNQELGDGRIEIQPDIEPGQAKVDEKHLCGGNVNLSTSKKHHPDTTEDSISMDIIPKSMTKTTTCPESESIPSPVLAQTDLVSTVPQVGCTQDKDEGSDEEYKSCDDDDTTEPIGQQKDMKDAFNPNEVKRSLELTASHYEEDDNASVSVSEKGSDVCSKIQVVYDRSGICNGKDESALQSMDENKLLDNDSSTADVSMASKITLKETDPMKTDKENISSTAEIQNDQKETIEAIGLEKYFPGHLTFEDVMQLTMEEKENEVTLKNISFIILRNLIMLEYSGRDNILHALYRSKNKTKHMQIHNPLDIILSIFLCLNPSLKSIFCSKMFMCHMAIPLMFYSPVFKEKIHFWMWPLHAIVINDGEVERRLVNSDQYVISFVRLGHPKISKSKIANEILHETAFPTFFHYDCKLGSSKKRCSRGLLEAAWYLPSSKQNDTFNKLTMILNLRGDLKENEKQMEFLKTVSNVMIIVNDGTSLGKTYFDKHLKDSVPVVFLLDDDDDDDDDDVDGNDQRRKRFSENPMVQFVYLKEFGQQISMAEVKESVLGKILSVITKDTNMLTITQMCQKAKEMGMELDTDECIGSKIKADKLFSMFKDEPLHLLKTRFTPLQTDLWKAYSDTEKEFLNGSHLTLEEKAKLDKEMINFRNKQVEKYREISTHNVIAEFIIHLESLIEADLYFFLETLTLHLNDMKMKEITKYQVQFDKAFNNLKSKPEEEEEKQLKQRDVQEEEQNLRDASFGVEHLFRELGQIFEAHSKNGDVDFDGNKVAKAVAKSIMLGYTFELMDGDVANIPLRWVKAVFYELNKLIGDKKIVTLSILGLESSGKSTLLNAMFGLSFPVSVGRCTRGINMRLLHVQKGMFDFDYVMVVDTEGLRTSELDKKSYQRDNALATVVLGMADISIINIKGENTSEIRDILQICVHAFLRLKLTNTNLKLRQSCIFIHQNVPAVNAKKQMGNSMKKLEETLDRITLEAALEENISDITRFSEIIKFDIDKHVWYFPDLWKGDPPMAPVNPGYSRSTNDVKNEILEQCSQIQTKYGNINECFIHLRDLWNGILANDFVFSFRNSLEMRSYTQLECHFNSFVWELELFKIELCKEFGKKINQFEKYEDLMKDEKNIEAETTAEFQEKGTQIKERLSSLFEDGKHKSEFVQWKNIKLIAWENEFLRLEHALIQETASLLEHCRMDLDMKDSYDKNKREIVKKASELAEKMKGNECDEEEMLRDFNKMWLSWISKWDVKEKYEDINVALRNILYTRFGRIKEQIDPEIKKIRNELGNRKLKCLAKCLDTLDFQSYIIVKPSLCPDALKFNKRKKKKRRNSQVVNLINIVFTEIDTKLQDLSQCDWKFNEAEVKEMTRCIIERIDEHNDRSKDFSISEQCKIKLHVAVFNHCLPLFEKLNKQYREKLSMKAKLEKHREIVWCHFSDTIQQKASDIVARNRFCDIIREHVEEYVRQHISDFIYTRVIEEFSMSKHELCISILTELAEEEQFDLYIQYIRNPSTYAFSWIKKYIDKKYFEKRNSQYYEISKMKTSQIVTKISDTVIINGNESLEEWLSEFQNEIKKELPISPDSFYLVREKSVSDMEDFRTKLVLDLDKMSNDIKEKFSRDKQTSIIWKGTTPYKRVMDKLWGCESVCPFCKEPCQWNSIHTGTPHSCIQHRSSGLSGWHGIENNIIVIESCSFNIQSNKRFRCGSIGTLCKRDSNKCSISETTDEYHPYRDYGKYTRDWVINPCPDISSSKYWAWVMCNFNDDLAKHYGLIKAKLPFTWELYNKEDAIKSLRET